MGSFSSIITRIWNVWNTPSLQFSRNTSICKKYAPERVETWRDYYELEEKKYFNLYAVTTRLSVSARSKWHEIGDASVDKERRESRGGWKRREAISCEWKLFIYFKRIKCSFEGIVLSSYNWRDDCYLTHVGVPTFYYPFSRVWKAIRWVNTNTRIIMDLAGVFGVSLTRVVRNASNFRLI